MTDTLRISPRKGERFCYDVRSQQSDSIYLVDLTQNFGNGQCSCLYYEHQAGGALHRRAEEARRDASIVGEDITEEECYLRAFQPYKRGVRGCTECKHIAACRNWLWSRRIRPLLHAWRNGPPDDWAPPLRKLFK